MRKMTRRTIFRMYTKSEKCKIFAATSAFLFIGSSSFGWHESANIFTFIWFPYAHTITKGSSSSSGRHCWLAALFWVEKKLNIRVLVVIVKFIFALFTLAPSTRFLIIIVDQKLLGERLLTTHRTHKMYSYRFLYALYSFRFNIHPFVTTYNKIAFEHIKCV